MRYSQPYNTVAAQHKPLTSTHYTLFLSIVLLRERSHLCHQTEQNHQLDVGQRPGRLPAVARLGAAAVPSDNAQQNNSMSVEFFMTDLMTV